MSLRFYSFLMQASDCLLSGLHRASRILERPLTALRCYAWLRCTKLNARKLHRQAIARTITQ